MRFTEFDLHDEVLDGLESMGFENATPIQEEAIPVILEGNDLIACAQTGTGKTAAFLIPLIDILEEIPGKFIKSLILCPTRELAMQIDRACEGLCYFSAVSSVPIYGGNKGGNDFSRQKAAIEQGSDILVATPGRLIQHLTLGYLDLSQVEFLILDEADRMLDMGFLPDLQRIINHLPEDRQTLMFSATMPHKIRKFAKEILYKPKEISIAVSKPAAGINQQIFSVYENQKLPLLKHIFKTEDVKSMIIFASRKSNVDQITKSLKGMNFDVAAMHSDRDQSEREQIMNDFKNHQIRILVATDILSRGIDVDSLSHVVNYNVPPDPEDYVHRIGRTARAGETGAAITFVTEEDQFKFSRIEKLIERKMDMAEMPDHIGEGPEYVRHGKRGGGFKGRGPRKGGGKGKKFGGRGGNKGKRGGGGNRGSSGGGRNASGGRGRNDSGGRSGGGNQRNGGGGRGRNDGGGRSRGGSQRNGGERSGGGNGGERNGGGSQRNGGGNGGGRNGGGGGRNDGGGRSSGEGRHGPKGGDQKGKPNNQRKKKRSPNKGKGQVNHSQEPATDQSNS